MARGILLTNRPFGDETLNSGGGGVILLKLPTAAATTAAVDCAGADVADAESGAQVLQLSHYSGTCPKDWCKSRGKWVVIDETNPHLTISQTLFT